MSPNLTVIITTFNDSFECLNRALESVINQTLKPNEVIIVDDGSSNFSSEKVYNRCKCSGVQLSLYKKPNGGPASARNYGLKYCSTTYVAFLDSDDEMLPDNIEKKVQGLNEIDDKYFGIYGGYIKNPGGIHVYMSKDGVVDADLIGKDLPGGVPSYVLNVNHVMRIGGFDESLIHNEDFDIIIRMIKSGLKVKGPYGAGFIRNYREGSVSRNDEYFKSYENVKKFLDKAERFSYFTKGELSARRFANETRLIRKIIAKPKLFFVALEHLDTAFSYRKPESFTQSFLLWLTKSIRFFLRLK